MIRSRTVITAKVESSYGTDPTPAATDAIEVMDLNLSFPSEMYDRKILKNTIGKQNPLLGRKYMVATFKTELKGSSAAGTAPDQGLLFRACGMVVTNVPATSDTYKPISTGHESITVWVYRDGILYEMNGVRGTWKLDIQVGKPAMMEWTLWGKVVAPIDVAIVSPTVDATDPPVAIASSFSLGGYASIISALDLDIGNNLVITDDINDASGYGKVIIHDRDPKGSFDPELVLMAAHNFWTDWTAGTQQALTITIGSSAGNRCVITAPKCVVREFNEADRGGGRSADIHHRRAKLSLTGCGDRFTTGKN